jgi:hypothetical protein
LSGLGSPRQALVVASWALARLGMARAAAISRAAIEQGRFIGSSEGAARLETVAEYSERI